MMDTVKTSPWAPLSSRTFAVIWTAVLVSNIGVWMRDVASGWIMTDLSPSPLMVSLVQAALTLPIFLLALPAGALADLLDRRKMMIAVQAFLVLVNLSLAATVWAGAMTPMVLLALTFAGGVGAALAAPAFQALVPELVPTSQLRAAVALNSMGVNVARAIGPVLGGVTLVTLGAAATYLLDAVTTVLVVAAFLWWRRDAQTSKLPPEAFRPAMTTGLRYVWRAADMKRVLLRAGAFFLFGSAYWALLPLIARQVLGGGATLYGLLLAAVGAGAVSGALLLQATAARSPGAIVLAGSLVTAAAIALLALVPMAEVAMAALFCAGAAWIAVITSLNVAAQTSLPNWVRARGMALYLTVFYGAMTAGSALWGQVAAAYDISTALLVAAGLGALVALVVARLPLPLGSADLTPSGHWSDPVTSGHVAQDRGPVMIEIDYSIRAEDREAFLAAIHDLAWRRMRDGAYGWQVFEDAAVPNAFREVFLQASWLDHLRLHGRVTRDDAAAQARVLAFHQGNAPVARHLLAARPGDGTPTPIDHATG
jgi:predicted MFS family arabinose efflux permease